MSLQQIVENAYKTLAAAHYPINASQAAQSAAFQSKKD